MFNHLKEADLFLISASGSLYSDGRLAMRQGITEEALKRYPGIDRKLGAAIQQQGERQNSPMGEWWKYHLLVSERYPQAKLGLFQSKHFWYTVSSLDLIQMSVAMLMLWLSHRVDAVVHMDYPGIELGLLPEKRVKPILEQLPDNVHIWRR